MDNMEMNNMKNGKRGKYAAVFGAGFLSGVVCSLFILLAGFGGQQIYDNLPAHFAKGRLFGRTEGSHSETFLDERSIGKLRALERLIAERFFGMAEVTDEQLETGIYRGLVAATGDRYAAYLTAEELAVSNNKMEGVFFGIGVLVAYDEELGLTVISGIIEGGAADGSGLREGDGIIAVDDADTTGFSSSSEVVDLIRGKDGTPVQITVYREGAPEFIVFDFIRRRVEDRNSVHYAVIEEDIGYIRITEFTTATVGQFIAGLADLRASGISGLVLDLRSNPGGSLAAVNAIARHLLPSGLVVYTEDRAGNRMEHLCDGKNELDIPLTVLVNRYSASAAEILAGAVRDHDKGALVGETTFGKGSIQSIIDLDDRTAVKLTTGAYFTPSGHNLAGIGITPDIEIEFDRTAYYEEGRDNQLQAAIAALR